MKLESEARWSSLKLVEARWSSSFNFEARASTSFKKTMGLAPDPSPAVAFLSFFVLFFSFFSDFRPKHNFWYSHKDFPLRRSFKSSVPKKTKQNKKNGLGSTLSNELQMYPVRFFPICEQNIMFDIRIRNFPWTEASNHKPPTISKKHKKNCFGNTK